MTSKAWPDEVQTMAYDTAWGTLNIQKLKLGLISLSISFCCFGKRRSIVPPLNVIPVLKLEEDWGVEREILWVWLQGRRHFWCSWWKLFSMYSQRFQRCVRSGQISEQSLSNIPCVWAKFFKRLLNQLFESTQIIYKSPEASASESGQLCV